MERSRTWQFSARAASVAYSTAFSFKTGSAPGSPRHTGQTLVLGGAPNWFAHPQNALVAVRSWTWTSSPMTASYFARISGGTLAVVAIDSLILAAEERRESGFGSGLA